MLCIYIHIYIGIHTYVCYVTLCYVVLYSVILCYVVLSCVMSCYVAQCHVMEWYGMVCRHCIVDFVVCCIVFELYSIVLYCVDVRNLI
jgi:hypothetical protein